MNNIELLTPQKIYRTKRKSISLIIKNNGDFIIRAPLKSSDKDIFNFIKQKANWIIKKRTEIKDSQVKPLDFASTCNLIGKSYEFHFHDKERVILTDNQIILPKENSKKKFILFLKKTALVYIEERVKLISNLFGFNYEKVSISSAKTCWGSCSVKNKLNFTYKLILCPLDVIDYVVLHELCHTKVKNHSKKFWRLVETCNPYYKNHEMWLKKNRAVIEMI